MYLFISYIPTYKFIYLCNIFKGLFIIMCNIYLISYTHISPKLLQDPCEYNTDLLTGHFLTIVHIYTHACTIHIYTSNEISTHPTSLCNEKWRGRKPKMTVLGKTFVYIYIYIKPGKQLKNHSYIVNLVSEWMNDNTLLHLPMALTKWFNRSFLGDKCVPCRAWPTGEHNFGVMILCSGWA